MIQDIAPRVFDPVYREKKPEPDDYVLHYSFNKVMLLRQGETCRIPTFRDLEGEGDWAAEAYYLFSIDGRAYYLNSERETPEFGDWVMEGLQIFRDFSPMYQAFAGITGSQIYRWRQSRKFCAALQAGGNDAQLCTLHRQGHGFLKDPHAYDVIYDFFARHLKG